MPNPPIGIQDADTGRLEPLKGINNALYVTQGNPPTTLTTAALTALAATWAAEAEPADHYRTTYIDSDLGYAVEFDGISAFVRAPYTVLGATSVYIADSGAPIESSLYDSDSILIAQATETANDFPITPQWNECLLDVGTLTGADTLTISISMNSGTTYRVIDPIDQSDGAQYGAAGVISAAGAYRFPIKGATHLRFTKTGANGSLQLYWKAVV